MGRCCRGMEHGWAWEGGALWGFSGGLCWGREGGMSTAVDVHSPKLLRYCCCLGEQRGAGRTWRGRRVVRGDHGWAGCRSTHPLQARRAAPCPAPCSSNSGGSAPASGSPHRLRPPFLPRKISSGKQHPAVGEEEGMLSIHRGGFKGLSVAPHHPAAWHRAVLSPPLRGLALSQGPPCCSSKPMGCSASTPELFGVARVQAGPGAGEGLEQAGGQGMLAAAPRQPGGVQGSLPGEGRGKGAAAGSSWKRLGARGAGDAGGGGCAGGTPGRNAGSNRDGWEERGQPRSAGWKWRPGWVW